MITPYCPGVRGGIENHVRNLSNYLESREWNVDIYTSDSCHLQCKTSTTIPIHHSTAIASPLNNPISPGMFIDLMTTKTLIYHIHGIYQFTSLVGRVASLLRKRIVILTCHGLANYHGMMGHFQRFYERGPARLVFGDVDGIVALTKYDATLLESMGYDKSRIKIIPNGIDSDFWKRKHPISNKVMNSDQILFVGRLDAGKNCAMLIRTFARLIEDNRSLQLVIAGAGAELSNLVRLKQEYNLNDRVSFLGHVDPESLRRLYWNSKMLVLPSLHEGLPTVILEAMAAGTLVITSRLKGLEDFIQNGQNGFFFRTGDDLDLEEKIRTLLELQFSRYEKITDNASRTIETKFDWKIVGSAIQKMYEDAYSSFRYSNR